MLSTKKKLVYLILFVLFALLCALIYQFVSLVQPKRSTAHEQKSFRHIRNIYGPPEIKFKRPHDIATDEQGNIYVTESSNGYVAVFDQHGNFLRQIGKKLSSIQHMQSDTKDYFINPLGISISLEDNRIYVADRSLEKIAVFSTDGKYINNWKVSMPLKPYAAGGKVYVTTSGPLYVFDKKGTNILGFGKRGPSALDFDFPNGLLVNEKADHMLVADSNNKRIKSLDLAGQLKWIDGLDKLDASQTGIKYELPTGLAVDDLGLLYSVDTLEYSIRVFAVTDEGLEYAASFGEYGVADAKFNYPTGIAYLGNRRFAVADSGNSRVQILEIPVTNRMKKVSTQVPENIKAKPPARNLLTKITDIFYSLIGF